VLSGHTHGGQIGFHERSVGERLWPERYLWGPYSRGDSRLYTTAGFGDWYPWRPGCPSEAALVELSSGEMATAGRYQRCTPSERPTVAPATPDDSRGAT
jgi:hypothetical protein